MKINKFGISLTETLGAITISSILVLSLTIGLINSKNITLKYEKIVYYNHFLHSAVATYNNYYINDSSKIVDIKENQALTENKYSEVLFKKINKNSSMTIDLDNKSTNHKKLEEFYQNTLDKYADTNSKKEYILSYILVDKVYYYILEDFYAEENIRNEENNDKL